MMDYKAWHKTATKTAKKKLQHNPVPTVEDRCIFCGKPYAQTHEIFYGCGRRQISIYYGLQVRLCDKCHKYIHDYPKSNMAVNLKRRGQERFEQEHTREEFIEEFGRNYL